MTFELLDKIETIADAFLATIMSTSGHTYEKAGARALFSSADPLPLHGDLGSLCADRELAAAGRDALRDGRPRVVRIDTSSEHDAELGYGTACGGIMDVLVEPILPAYRETCRHLRAALESGQGTWLVHDVRNGSITLAAAEPSASDDVYIEWIAPARRVVVFGATPLAERLVDILAGAGFDVHVLDWRRTYLERLGNVTGSRRHLDDCTLDPDTRVVLVSHSYERDREMLRRALESRCRYIGMLSSRPRRDSMFDELVADGIERTALERVSSPVGLELGARGDGEIAVSIAAEILAGEAR